MIEFNKRMSYLEAVEQLHNANYLVLVQYGNELVGTENELNHLRESPEEAGRPVSLSRHYDGFVIRLLSEAGYAIRQLGTAYNVDLTLEWGIGVGGVYSVNAYGNILRVRMDEIKPSGIRWKWTIEGRTEGEGVAESREDAMSEAELAARHSLEP